MGFPPFAPHVSHRRSLGLVILSILLIGGLGTALVAVGTLQDFEPGGVATVSRTLNQLMAVVMTSIALIIPLTANLYTPRLVKLYVAHPLIVGGLVSFMVGHALIVGLHYTAPGHLVHRILAITISAHYLASLALALPYLFFVSQLLRPSFFMPMLTRKGIARLRQLDAPHPSLLASREFFETVNVLTNVALTGVARGDRQLVLLALQSLHVLLMELVAAPQSPAPAWRTLSPVFLPGIAQEGQTFLTRERLWPEAYVLGQVLKVLEVAGQRQHEILAEVAGSLVESARLALVAGRPQVTELHVMVFNTLLRRSVEDRDLRLFQNLSYHYRLLVEAFHEDPTAMLDAAAHLVHYGHLASAKGPSFGLETIAYDLGELALSLARLNPERAAELVQVHAGPLWQDGIEGGTLMKKVGWRAVLRLYWEARAEGHTALTEALYWRFLSDEAIHREQLELALDENRELHYEFNDRLMRFASFSPQAEAAAHDFLESW